MRHADEGADARSHRDDVLEGLGGKTTGTLPSYDATALIGIKTVVKDAVIATRDDEGEVTVEVPKLRELMAASAIARCLLPVRLRGGEIRAMRKIMHMTIADLAKKLDDKTAPETISRWESETQQIGGYVEKLIRLLVCETLKDEAPGVAYDAKKIAYLRVLDPWREIEAYQVPALEFSMVRLKSAGEGGIVDAWDYKEAA